MLYRVVSTVKGLPLRSLSNNKRGFAKLLIVIRFDAANYSVGVFVFNFKQGSRFFPVFVVVQGSFVSFFFLMALRYLDHFIIVNL